MPRYICSLQLGQKSAEESDRLSTALRCAGMTLNLFGQVTSTYAGIQAGTGIR
jgi:hypothetical protein